MTIQKKFHFNMELVLYHPILNALGIYHKGLKKFVVHTKLMVDVHIGIVYLAGWEVIGKLGEE